MILTAVNRELDGYTQDYLRREAYTAGVDGRHRFGANGNYEITGQLFGSLFDVAAKPRAIRGVCGGDDVLHAAVALIPFTRALPDNAKDLPQPDDLSAQPNGVPCSTSQRQTVINQAQKNARDVPDAP